MHSISLSKARNETTTLLESRFGSARIPFSTQLYFGINLKIVTNQGLDDFKTIKICLKVLSLKKRRKMKNKTFYPFNHILNSQQSCKEIISIRLLKLIYAKSNLTTSITFAFQQLNKFFCTQNAKTNAHFPINRENLIMYSESKRKCLKKMFKLRIKS